MLGSEEVGDRDLDEEGIMVARKRLFVANQQSTRIIHYEKQ